MRSCGSAHSHVADNGNDDKDTEVRIGKRASSGREVCRKSLWSIVRLEAVSSWRGTLGKKANQNVECFIWSSGDFRTRAHRFLLPIGKKGGREGRKEGRKESRQEAAPATGRRLATEFEILLGRCLPTTDRGQLLGLAFLVTSSSSFSSSSFAFRLLLLLLLLSCRLFQPAVRDSQRLCKFHIQASAPRAEIVASSPLLLPPPQQ